MNSLVKFLFIVVAPTIALAATSHGPLILNIPLKIENQFFSLDTTWSTVILLSYFIISTVFFIFTYTREIISDKSTSIEKLKKEKADLKKDLQNQASGLWRELKYLNKYKQNEVLTNVMETYVKNKMPVVSVQMYEYYFNRNGFFATTDVKINHIVGYAKEGTNQNAILQAYYSIPTYKLSMFYKARAITELGYKNLTKAITRFASRYIRELNDKGEDELNKQDVFLLALLILSFEKLDLNDDLRVTKHDDALHRLHKNGILRGILDDGEYYSFTYRGTQTSNNEKITRTYLTKRLMINGVQNIFVITVDIKDNLLNMQQLGNEFLELVVASDLNVEYN